MDAEAGMTFSPELEARFAKMLGNYPPGRQKGALVPMLIYAQDEVGAITPELVAEVARRLKVKPIEVEEVVEFYSMLHRRPLGKHHIQICTNIACQLTGGEDLWAHACTKLGIGHKQVTKDGLFSLEEVECMGACSWAPAIQDGYKFHHDMTVERFDELVEKLRFAEQGS
jgi:NADH-quinone oxidoreductase subunit E